MGVVNVTPDSFSDGGRFLDPQLAIAHARRLEDEGADILDIGGESTRPGAAPVAAEEELRRVLPVLEALVAQGVRSQLSIDTSKAVVAAAALAAGATLVNDVTALRADPGMARVVAEAGAEICLMHMLGEPRTMQDDPRYEDVVGEVKRFLAERAGWAIEFGIPAERILLDPGIGFGKTAAHNLKLLNRLDELAELGFPMLIGTSRKSFLGSLTGRDDPQQRLAGTIASCVLAYERGANVFRVHEVAPVKDALAVAAATVSPRWRTPSTTR